MARIAFGGFRHETNTFAAGQGGPGGLQPRRLLPAPDPGPGPVRRHCRHEYLGLGLRRRGPRPGPRAGAPDLVRPPFLAPTPRSAPFETVSAWLLEDIAAAGKLDAIYLDLHGAMVAEHTEDGEGELLRRVRGLVGPDMPIVLALDYHSNTTAAMIELATGMAAYRTYPHVDRGRDRTARGAPPARPVARQRRDGQGVPPDPLHHAPDLAMHRRRSGQGHHRDPGKPGRRRRGDAFVHRRLSPLPTSADSGPWRSSATAATGRRWRTPSTPWPKK